MNFKPDTYHLTMGILLAILAILGYRLLRIFLKRQRRAAQSKRQQSDLLMDALKARTLGERRAMADHQASEQALRSMQELHSRVIEHIPVGIAVAGDQGEIAYANQLSVQWLGPLPPIGGLAQWSPQLGSFFHNQKIRGNPESQLLRISRNDRHKTFLVSLTHLPDKRWMLTIQDQTRMLQLEEQVWVKRDLALMGEMASGITHEVKNALAVIQGHVQMLKYGEVDDHAEDIQIEIDRLLDCVSQFMRSSKGELPLLEPIPLADLFGKLKEHWQNHPFGEHVHLQIPKSELVIYGDMGQLMVLFNNLILNGLQACEFSQPDGFWVRVFVNALPDQICIVAEDAGPGFSNDVMEKLFVPFVSTREKGSGFGLFHCRRIMFQHQGQITVAQGPPTRVNCRFPRNVSEL